MDFIKDGWFHERGTLWPAGQAFSLQLNKALHHSKSPYQDVLVVESTHYGNVLILDGVIQVTERKCRNKPSCRWNSIKNSHKTTTMRVGSFIMVPDGVVWPNSFVRSIEVVFFFLWHSPRDNEETILVVAEREACNGKDDFSVILRVASSKRRNCTHHVNWLMKAVVVFKLCLIPD